tara:strand:+ start:731 stop:1087 length:357 start_codon:yes stop_codon:yes gene_type:complete
MSIVDFIVRKEMSKTSTAQDFNTDPLSFRHGTPQEPRPQPYGFRLWEWDGFSKGKLVDNRQYRKWQRWMAGKMANATSTDQLVALMKLVGPSVNTKLVFGPADAEEKLVDAWRSRHGC